MTALTIAAILVSVLSIGGISIFSIRSGGDRDSVEKMVLICESTRKTLNEYLLSIEQSVDMVSRYAGEELTNVALVDGGVIGATGFGDSPRLEQRTDEQRQRLDAYLQEHCDTVEEVMNSVSNHTNGVLTYYYRINPELSTNVRGFWYSRQGSDEFLRLPPTDIPGYAQDDISHVGWYYIPLTRGRPSWMEPYYNENLGVQIVSYVVPIYKPGTFIGVIGMDIRFDTLISQIQDIQIYDTGYAFLTDENGRVLYHPTLDMGTDMASMDATFEGIAGRLKDPEIRRYTYAGSDKLLVYQTLANEMKLLVAAPLSEINAAWTRLATRILLFSLLLLAVFAAVTLFTMKRITEPLQRLTDASRLLADGDYNVTLDYSGHDEVGTLTAAFQKLVNHLRIYISDLNSKAYQDAMTGVKNKGAYAISARQLNDAIGQAETGEEPKFAIVMLDCNNLKTINDKYGHDKGDLYLQTACELVCRVFTHSPVFRLGGDEFSAILQKEDYAKRRERLKEFDRMAAEVNARAENPWEEIHIAKGMAVYDVRRDKDVESVLHRADDRMYQDKKRMKAMRHETPRHGVGSAV